MLSISRARGSTQMANNRKRHSWTTKIWHWVNLLCVVILFMSGLNISNAHRYLYWGDYGFNPADAWLAVPRFRLGHDPGFLQSGTGARLAYLIRLAMRPDPAVHVDRDAD